jgi:hypothetical protein
MKNLKSINILILILAFISCSNKLFDVKTETTENDIIGKAIERERQMKEVYIKLTPIEKSKIWHDRVLTLLKNENLNGFERKFLKDIIRIINPALFVTSNSNEDLIEEYKSKSIALFGKLRSEVYFTTLTVDFNTFKNIVEYSRDTIPPNKISKRDSFAIVRRSKFEQKCHCSTQSDFCFGFSDCTLSDCTREKIRGCGFLLSFSCDGLCR